MPQSSADSFNQALFALQWIQAIVFFTSMEPHTSLQIHKRLLRGILSSSPFSSSPSSPSSVDTIIVSKLYSNIGFIHGFLGEYYEAGNAFEESVKYDGSSILAWFGLGSACSQLRKYTRAGQAFLKCRDLLDELHLGGVDPGIWVDYYEMKFSPAIMEDIMTLQPKQWFLNRVRIEWNIRMTFFDKVEKAEGTALAGVWGSNGVPAGTVFGPPMDFIPDKWKARSPANSPKLHDTKPLPPIPAPIEEITFGTVPCHQVAITNVTSPPRSSLPVPSPIPVPTAPWGEPGQWQPFKRCSGERFFVPDFKSLKNPNDPETPPKTPSPVAHVFPPRRSSLPSTNRRTAVGEGFNDHQTAVDTAVDPSMDEGFLLPATRFEGFKR